MSVVWLSIVCLGKGSFEKKKKVKNFLNLCPDPPPPKKLRKTKIYFFSMLTQQIFSAGEEKNLWKKIEKYCTFGHYHEDYPSSTGQKGVPPHMKKNFLCRFGWIRTWKNKNKKVKKMRKVCPDPPTLLRNFLTFFFFRMNPSLMIIMFIQGTIYNVRKWMVTSHFIRSLFI